MKQITYWVHNLSPLNFAEKNNDATLYTTRDYITGSAVRGMMAEAFIRQYKLGKEAHKNQSFYDLFLSGKVRFLPAYPLSGVSDKGKVVFQLPLSMMRSKDGKIIKDISGVGAPEAGFKKMKGFVVQDGQTLYPVSVKKKITLHMARNTSDEARRRGKSEDGGIFNYEAMEPGQWFQGTILCDDDCDAEPLLASCFSFSQDNLIHLGHSRQTEYGACQLQLVSGQTSYRELDASQPVYLYALTPYIPWNEWQRVTDIAEALVTQLEQRLSEKTGHTVSLHPASGTLNTSKIFAANEDVTGYLAVWNGRRERKNALSAASLIPIDAEKLSAEDLHVLQDLLYQGIGCRREEGFGQFRLWQPLTDVSLADHESQPITGGVIPHSVVYHTARKIIRKRLLAEVQNRAALDAGKLKSGNVGKHILNRVEILMESHQTQQEIQDVIEHEFKKIAKDNLVKFSVGDMSLCDKLLQPQLSFDWIASLHLQEGQQERLEHDLGQDVFSLDQNVVYKWYWLWFVRHVKKAMAMKGAGA